MVQLGSGGSAIKSESKPLNIRFNKMNSFPENYNLVEASWQPNGHAFAPDGSAWSVVDQWGWPNCLSGGPIALADGLTRTLPDGTRAAHIATCPHNDLTGGEYAERVRVIGGTPYWTCGFFDYTKLSPICYSADNRYADFILPSTQYRLDANGAVETYGQAAGDVVTFTAAGERLLREPCTGNYILYKRKTNPDGTVTESLVTVHSDGGLNAGRSSSDGFSSPITGPGGQIGFINPGPAIPPGYDSAFIERFNPDGSWHDEIVVYGDRFSFFQLFMASAFDCQGNLYYVEDVKDPRPYYYEAISGKLHKIAWQGSSDVVVDADLSSTLNPDPFYNLGHQYMLSGINPAGDIYFERNDTHAAPNQYPDRCTANYDLWYRHPKVRGEACEAAKVSLSAYGDDPDSVGVAAPVPSTASATQSPKAVASGGCIANAVLFKDDKIPLGYMGNFDIRAKINGIAYCVELIEMKVHNGATCHVDSTAEDPRGVKGNADPIDHEVPLNDVCLATFRSQPCEGDAECRIWKNTGVPMPAVWASHLGSFKADVKFYWPSAAGPAPADCTDLNGKKACKADVQYSVIPGKLGKDHNEVDEVINRYANFRTIPPQLIKAHAHEETACNATIFKADCMNPRTYRYELAVDLGLSPQTIKNNSTDYLPFKMEFGSADDYIPARVCTPGNPAIYDNRGDKLTRDGSDVEFRSRYRAWLGKGAGCVALTGFNPCNVTAEQLFIASEGGIPTGNRCGLCRGMGYTCTTSPSADNCPLNKYTLCLNRTYDTQWNLYAGESVSCPQGDIACFERWFQAKACTPAGQTICAKDFKTAQTVLAASYGLYNFVARGATDPWNWKINDRDSRKITQLTEADYATNLESWNLHDKQKNICRNIYNSLNDFLTQYSTPDSFVNGCWVNVFQQWNRKQPGYGAGIVAHQRYTQPRLP